MPYRSAVLVTSLAVLLSSAALAKPKGQTPTDIHARKLLDSGIASLASRDFKAATQALGDSYRSQPTAEALFYLGALALAEGRTLEAQDLMRRYLADPRRGGSADTPEVQQAQRISAQTLPPHGQISILGQDGTLLFVDGRLRGSLPIAQPLLVAPGERTVLMEANGRRQEQTLVIREGQFFELQHSPASGAFVVLQLPSAVLVNTIDPLSADATPLAAVIEKTLRAEHFALLPSPSADGRLPRCLEDAGCLAQLGERAAADYLLLVRPEHQAADWKLRMQVIDVHIGDVAASADLHCASCTAEQAAAELGSALPSLLLQAKSRLHGNVKLTSQPSGAEVYLGERLLGRTPLTHALWIGAHDLTFTFAGLQRQVQRVDIAQEQTAELHIEFPQAPAPVVRPAPGGTAAAAPAPATPAASRRPSLRERFAHMSPRSRWLLIGGAAAVPLGALLLGFGASALAVGSPCAGQPLPPGGICPEAYHTAAPGATLVTFGGALLLTGVGLIVLPNL